MGCSKSKPEKKPQPVPQPSRPQLDMSSIPQPPPPAEQPSGNMSKKFGVPSSKHHLIIGKGGATIKHLEATHNVNIEVSSRDKPQDVVVIEGPLQGIEAARQEIEQTLDLDIPEDAITIFELDVPEHKFGAVVGKGASTLREIEKESRACVAVPPRDSSGVAMKVEGTKAACSRAVSKISDVIGLPVTVKCESQGGVQLAVGEAPKVNLSKEVRRVLFFPDHVEPEGKRTLHVFLEYLGSVTRTLDICIFTLTNNDIANTVLSAHRRGVKVRVVCDDDQSNSLGADIHKLIKAGIPVREDKTKAHMHHKFAVLDGQVLLNGSFNWTLQAQTSNNENVMITSDKYFVKEFTKHFELLWNEFK